jgi:predicted MFS family arabinose efflux permease
MLLVDGLRALLVGGLGWLAWDQGLELWHIYLATVLLGMMSAFFRPAYIALIPEITPRELLPSANALTELGWQLTGIAGPALGALIIAWGGTAAAFFLDSLTFLIAALCLLPLVRSVATLRQAHEATPDVPPTKTPQSILGDIGEGLVVIRRVAWLWGTMLMFALINLTGRSPMNVSLPFLVKDNLKAEVDSLGLLLALFSGGSVLGTLWLGSQSRLRRRGLAVYQALGVVGLATAAMGLPISLPGVGLAVLILGLALAIANLTWANLKQETIPKAFFGRVASLQTLTTELILPIGFSLAGWATDQFSAAPVFIVGGLLTAALAGVGLLQPAIRSLD